MGARRKDPVTPTSCGNGVNMQDKLGVEVCEVSKKNNGPQLELVGGTCLAF